MHTHSDLQLLLEPAHEAKVMQGVTLEVLGQDGLGVAPLNDESVEIVRSQVRVLNGDPPNLTWRWWSLAEYLSQFDRRVATNVATFVGQGTVRMNIMHGISRP